MSNKVLPLNGKAKIEGMGMKKLKSVGDVDVYMHKTYLFAEPALYMKIPEGDFIKLTVPSTVYELFDYEYFYNEPHDKELKKYADQVMAVICKDNYPVEQGNYEYFIVTDDTYDKIKKLLKDEMIMNNMPVW